MSLEAADKTERSRDRKLIPFPRLAERRRRHELEFLPAALEIIETPTSRAGRIMIGVIVLLVMIAIAWAGIGRLDIVATATGRIIPSARIKLIQPLQLGVVKSIRVRDGEEVRAGDVLVELDPTTEAADRDQAARDLMQAELDIARLRAELAGDVTGFVAPVGADPALADAKRWEMSAELTAHKAKIDGLDRQIEAKTAERDQAQAHIEKIDAALPFLRQKAQVYELLQENRLSSRISMLDAEKQLSDEQHDRVVSTRQLQRAGAEIAALRQQRDEAEAEFRRRLLDELGKATQYASEQREALIKSAARARLQVLRAPVSGTIEQLAVHTIGGVVQPAQTLMVLVPGGSTLEAEAMLPNRDAGFVRAGQPAEIKVEAFPYTRYGLLHGVVRTVSRDALRREADAPNPNHDTSSTRNESANKGAAGADSAYTIRIALAETDIETEGGPLPLEPGMTITAEIKTGRRHLISYLLSPFMRYRHDALSER